MNVVEELKQQVEGAIQKLGDDFPKDWIADRFAQFVDEQGTTALWIAVRSPCIVLRQRSKRGKGWLSGRAVLLTPKGLFLTPLVLALPSDGGPIQWYPKGTALRTSNALWAMFGRKALRILDDFFPRKN